MKRQIVCICCIYILLARSWNIWMVLQSINSIPTLCNARCWSRYTEGQILALEAFVFMLQACCFQPTYKYSCKKAVYLSSFLPCFFFPFSHPLVRSFSTLLLDNMSTPSIHIIPRKKQLFSWMRTKHPIQPEHERVTPSSLMEGRIYLLRVSTAHIAIFQGRSYI